MSTTSSTRTPPKSTGCDTAAVRLCAADQLSRGYFHPSWLGQAAVRDLGHHPTCDTAAAHLSRVLFIIVGGPDHHTQQPNS